MCKNKGRAFNYCSQKMVLLSHCTNCRSEAFLSLGTIYKRGSQRRSNIIVHTALIRTGSVRANRYLLSPAGFMHTQSRHVTHSF